MIRVDVAVNRGRRERLFHLPMVLMLRQINGFTFFHHQQANRRSESVQFFPHLSFDGHNHSVVQCVAAAFSAQSIPSACCSLFTNTDFSSKHAFVRPRYELATPVWWLYGDGSDCAPLSDQHISAEIKLIFRRRDPSRDGWKPELRAMKKNLWKLTSQCL